MALWRVLRGAGSWTGGGITPLRLDRAAVIRRSGVPDWIADELMDAFEPAALTALHAAEKRRKKSNPTPES